MMSLAKSKLTWQQVSKILTNMYQQVIQQKRKINMKAAQHTIYDKNNLILNITTIEKPTISKNQVLVKVKTAGVNPLDNMISRGEVKLIVPYTLPQTAGNEVVGIVEEVGSEVTAFKNGDRVFGRLPLDAIGAFAEYVAVDSDALAFVPDYLSDEEAAAVPLTALTIMQALELMGAEAGKTIFSLVVLVESEEWQFQLQKRKGSQLLQMGMHRIKNAFYPLVQTDSSITKQKIIHKPLVMSITS